MELLVLRSWWTGPSNLDALIQQTLEGGFDGIGFDGIGFDGIGFDGIEGPIPQNREQRESSHHQLRNNGLVFIAEATIGTDPESPKDWWIPRPDRSIDDHLDDLKWVVDHARGGA